MSSEKRVVRPYSDLGPFQDALDKWLLRIGHEELVPGDQRTIASSSFLADPVVIVCAEDDDDLATTVESVRNAAHAIDLRDDDVELVVIVSTAYLRFADVAFRGSLCSSQPIPQEVRLSQVDPRPRALSTPQGGMVVDAYLLLANEQEAKPLRPSRRGTWLGHVVFELRTELGEIGFTPQPLTAEVRTEHGLPQDAIRYVSLDADALRGDDLAAVELYVDVPVLAQLNQAPHSPAARFFQRQLFLDVVSAIVRTARQEEDLMQMTLDELDGTVLGRIVHAAAGKGRPGESKDEQKARQLQALQQLRSQPEKFVAHLEASAAPRADLEAAISGGEA